MKLGGYRGGEDLGRLEERKNMVEVYYMKNIKYIFKKKINSQATHLIGSNRSGNTSEP